MHDLVINLPFPHPKQADILRTRAHRVVCVAGRRSGKTTLAASVAIEKMLQGRRVLLASTTQEQADAFWDKCKTWLADVIESGLVVKNESRRTLSFPSQGGRIRCKTASDADTLRGDYADFLVLDECALLDPNAWETVGAPMLLDNDGDAWFLSTPLPGSWFRKLYDKAREDTTGRWQAFHFTSRENPHISQAALDQLASDMTARKMRQEIDAEFLDDVPGALWTRAMLDATRVSSAPELVRIVVAVDPSATSTGDACGIIVCGKAADGQGYLLEDCTIQGSPRTWALQAVAAYHRHRADRLVAESNNGGEMVATTIQTIDGAPPVHLIHASRGKMTRAEPIAAQYEKGRVHHVGFFGPLEDELCGYDGTGASPNRLDAAVWGLTELGLHFSLVGSGVW